MLSAISIAGNFISVQLCTPIKTPKNLRADRMKQEAGRMKQEAEDYFTNKKELVTNVFKEWESQLEVVRRQTGEKVSKGLAEKIQRFSVAVQDLEKRVEKTAGLGGMTFKVAFFFFFLLFLLLFFQLSWILQP